MDTLTPVILSLKIAIIATIVVLVLGILLAKVMTQFQFLGKDLVEALVTLPLVLPPTVIGFILLLVFGHNGPLGKLIDFLFHSRIIFTWGAAVIASTVVAFPMMYRSTVSALENVDPKLEMAARTLGASEWKVFFTVSLPLARFGVLSGLVMSFARALGEFGATLMIAGNIPGQTQTMPLAIYFSLESGDTRLAWLYVLLMTVMAFLAISLVNKWSKKKGYPLPERRKPYATGLFTKDVTGL